MHQRPGLPQVPVVARVAHRPRLPMLVRSKHAKHEMVAERIRLALARAVRTEEGVSGLQSGVRA